MEQLHANKNNSEKKGSHLMSAICSNIVEAEIIVPERASADSLAENSELNNTKQIHIPFFIFLVIGILLQLTGNTFCVQVGTLVCFSVCGLICISVLISAVFSRSKLDSPAGTP